MRDSVRGLMIFILVAMFATGCEVTAEKVELWKGTVNGPKKLAGTVIDPEISIGLRGMAAVALVEINAWDLYRDAFTKIEKEDAKAIVKEIVPQLTAIVEKGNAEKKVSKPAVDAKDGLAMILDYAGPESRPAIDASLIQWCVGDYNARAMAGQYNITTIVKKLGPKAAEALIPMLAMDQLVIKHAAELIRKVDDPEVMKKASEHYAKELMANIPKIEERHLEVAAIIGGESLGSTLLTLATDANLSEGLQRFALRAFSVCSEQGLIKPNTDHVGKLFAMAENEELYDQYQREETFYTIAQAKRKEDLPRFKKLLENGEFFWRAVGFRCILRVDGENQMEKTLVELSKSRKVGSDDVQEFSARIATFKKLLPTVRTLLDNSSVFVQAVAIGAIGEMGFKKDIEVLKKYSGSKAKLPKHFEHKSLGEAATAAIEAITKRG